MTLTRRLSNWSVESGLAVKEMVEVELRQISLIVPATAPASSATVACTPAAAGMTAPV